MTATATYDPALSTLKDHIRLALGDTDMTAALLLDATIAAKLAAFTYPEALAQCAEALVSEVAQDPDRFSDSKGVTLQWSSRISAWQKIADNARAGKIKTPAIGTRTAVRIPAAVSQMNVQATTDPLLRTD